MNKIIFEERYGWHSYYVKKTGPGNDVERDGMGMPIQYHFDD